MKDKVRVSAVQFAPAWLEREKNAARMRDFVDAEARQHGAELVVFPELANIGYICPFYGFDPDFAQKYIRASEPIPGPTTETLGEVARRRGVYVMLGMSQSHPTISGTLYNSAALIGPTGRVIGVHHKVHIPAGEKHYFIPGNTAEVYQTELGPLAMTVCYDGRFPELARVLALKGAEIVCAVWAMPHMSRFIDPQNLKYRAFTRAQENAYYYIACNRSGVEGDTVFLGHSAIAAPNGEVIAFSETDAEEVLRAELSAQVLSDARTFLSIFRDRRPDMYGAITEPLSQPYAAG